MHRERRQCLTPVGWQEDAGQSHLMQRRSTLPNLPKWVILAQRWCILFRETSPLRLVILRVSCSNTYSLILFSWMTVCDIAGNRLTKVILTTYPRRSSNLGQQALFGNEAALPRLAGNSRPTMEVRHAPIPQHACAKHTHMQPQPRLHATHSRGTELYSKYR